MNTFITDQKLLIIDQSPDHKKQSHHAMGSQQNSDNSKDQEESGGAFGKVELVDQGDDLNIEVDFEVDDDQPNALEEDLSSSGEQNDGLNDHLNH